MITNYTVSKIQTSPLRQSHIQFLLSQLDQKTFSATAYDTAWVARVTNPSDAQRASYPQALDWLRQTQHADGSWGGGIEYFHDRIISTLSTILALAERGDQAGDRNAIIRGEQYIQQNFDQLAREAHDTVGFELLLPVLFDQADQLGLNLPYAKCEYYRRLRAEKLSMIPHHLLYSRQVSSTHSLEFLGNHLDIEQLDGSQEPNGSYGNSPSATAFVLQHCPLNQPARGYLDVVLTQGGGAAMPAHPVDIFNKSWVLYNLELAGLLGDFITQARAHLQDLWESWDPKLGVGFARHYPVADLDDTAVVFKLLRQAGYPVNPGVFLPYEREGHFACYAFERTPSVGANVHLLDALSVCPEYEHRPRIAKKILRFLRTSRLEGAYWLDKWHISPYYITSHAVMALIGSDNALARDAIQWMLATQREDGSWGHFQSTSEETAYCLQALIAYHHQVDRIDEGAIYRGADFLNQQYGLWDLPEMWIEKCLFTPTHIVESTILSALVMSSSL